MFQNIPRNAAPAFGAALLVCSIVGGGAFSARAASGATARCHCPCAVQCGGGVSCECGGHGESCAKCSCAAGELEAKDIFWLAQAAAPLPVLAGSYAPWFAFDPHAEIRAAVEATMADTGMKEAFPIRFVLDAKEPMQYVPDEKFSPEALRSWLRRADAERPAYLYAAAKDDPATYAIRDGERSHLNESLHKVYTIRFGDGAWREVFRSDSTLAWEMIAYLKSAVGQLPERAFVADAERVKGGLYDRIETLQLLLNASSYDAALRVVDEVVKSSAELGLDPSNAEAEVAVCAFRKMRSLLDNGKTPLVAVPGGTASFGTE